MSGTRSKHLPGHVRVFLRLHFPSEDLSHRHSATPGPVPRFEEDRWPSEVLHYVDGSDLLSEAAFGGPDGL
jgi:hypothetical protein